MRYHYEKPVEYKSIFGKVYYCEHELYYRCTLYSIGGRGLAVIQQRFDPVTKSTYWSNIDEWLTDDIFLHVKFKDYFNRHAKPTAEGIYPTVTVRQLMWALKMKPIPKSRWETVFDRRDI